MQTVRERAGPRGHVSLLVAGSVVVGGRDHAARAVRPNHRNLAEAWYHVACAPDRCKHLAICSLPHISSVVLNDRVCVDPFELVTVPALSFCFWKAGGFSSRALPQVTGDSLRSSASTYTVIYRCSRSKRRLSRTTRLRLSNNTVHGAWPRHNPFSVDRC